MIFMVQCYANAVYAMALCLFVCVSVTSQCSAKTAQWIELIFDMEASSTYLTQEIRVTPKIRILPSRILSQTLDLENFATASRL